MRAGREVWDSPGSALQDPGDHAYVLNVIMSEVGTFWRAMGRRVTWSDFHFHRFKGQGGQKEVWLGDYCFTPGVRGQWIDLEWQQHMWEGGGLRDFFRVASGISSSADVLDMEYERNQGWPQDFWLK